MRNRLAQFWTKYHYAVKVGAAIGLSISVVIILITVTKTLDQSRRNSEQIKDQLVQIKKENGEIKDHIDCVAKLMTRANRETLRIEDIKNCRIVSDSTNKTVPAQPPSPNIPRATNPGASNHTPKTPNRGNNSPRGLLKKTITSLTEGIDSAVYGLTHLDFGMKGDDK